MVLNKDARQAVRPVEACGTRRTMGGAEFARNASGARMAIPEGFVPGDGVAGGAGWPGVGGFPAG